ncbi:MAG TPA: Gfo/Idh/MocA family oxidoreductase [Verrucomicrobiae bacterium]
METNSSTPKQTPISPVTRRTFLRNGAILTAGIATLSPAARAQTNQNSKLRIFQIGAGVQGAIGGMQRGALKGYDKCEFVGFCDVDTTAMDKVSAEYPGSWKELDYREAFAKRANDFDAVIVDTPDFHHAPMMLMAMKHNKHIYGQKPLVQQLDELRLIKEGLDARPNLVTQMGNQRACNLERMQAVEILRKNQLGKPVEAFVWTGGVERGNYFTHPWAEYTTGKTPPDSLNWDLWNGPLEQQIPYSDEIHPRRWRTFWETGGGQLADWGCHLLDALYFAYDLPSPEAVVTYCQKPPNTAHTAYNQSILTYPGGSGKFVREKFVVHYNDSSIQPSFAALGLPPMRVGANHTLVVCEEGTLLLQADGKTTIFRKGKVVEDEPMPDVGRRNHWRDWVDNCQGAKKPLWTPFQIGVRITEPALLAAKATKFPGQELRWDGKAYKFTNHEKANETIVKRNYRAGFEPPKVA